MSYLRWFCSMHFAKLTRHGNAVVETVNAFRLHRQQKTLACEAAAKANAEFWSRLSENLRQLRTRQPVFLRKSLQARRLDNEHPTYVNAHETGTETVPDSGSFRSEAKQVAKCTFRGAQSSPASTETSSLSAVFGSNFEQAGQSLGKLLHQQQQSLPAGVLQQPQTQRQLPANSANNKNNQETVAASKKSLALFTMSRSFPWPEGESQRELQQPTLQADQKTASKADKPTDEPPMLVPTIAPSQRTTFTISKSLSTLQKYDSPCWSPQKQKAILLPERPNILVLPQMSDLRAVLQRHAAVTDNALQQKCVDFCDQSLRLLPAPAKPLKSTADCQISTKPEGCVLPPKSDNPMRILVTNVLDKYKIISLPAGGAIPGRPRRYVLIEAKKRGSLQGCIPSEVKRRKF